MFVIFGAALLHQRSFRIRFDTTSALICIFLFILLPINFFKGISNNLAPDQPIRGIIPFIFLVSYLLLNQLSDYQKTQLQTLLTIAAGAWALSIILLNFNVLIDVLRGDIARLTYSVRNMLVPFGLVGTAFVLYAREMPQWMRWTILAIFLVLIVASGYRSQLALAALMIVVRYRNLVSLKSLAAMVLIIVTAVVFTTYNPTYLTMMIERFQYSSGDDVRSLEIDFALGVFSQNPIFGGGVGYPVPVAATRPLRILEYFEQDYVPYIHNFVAYTLMGFGISGAIFFALLLLVPIIRNLPVFLTTLPNEKEAALLLLVVLLAYFQISASFRQIQMWVVISSLLVILNSGKKPASCVAQ